jgi:hypothetical protein
MTVCIGAACGDGRSVVLASDRMFTVPAPIVLEFETSKKRANRSPASPQQFLYCSFIGQASYLVQRAPASSGVTPIDGMHVDTEPGAAASVISRVIGRY